MWRWLTETTTGRVALLVGAVAVVLLGSAALAHFAFDEFGSYGAALWSATLHLLDPSTLQDDEGAAARAIGVFQVVTGLVLLVGLLFTFVSEVVGRSLERLGQSDRPVRARDHLLVIGGTDLIGVVTRVVAGKQKVAGIERLVVLAPESARESREQIREELDDAAGGLRVELVFGDTAGDSGFELGAAGRARAILVMASTGGQVPAEAADVEVTQSGLALLDHLRERKAEPLVRLLFRRGRNVDASWDLFPDEWDALVGDRTVSAVLRVAMTRPDLLEKLPGRLAERGRIGDYARLTAAAWEAAARESRPLRLTIAGCGVNAAALMEDLAEAGAERFAVTMVAAREAFERYLGSEEPSGVRIELHEAEVNDPERMQRQLVESRPDLLLVTPSPLTWDLRSADASATLTVMRALRTVGEETPLLAEVFLPETARRLPDDPRLLAISTMRSVATAVALSLFDPARAAELERRLAAGDGDS
ncbi:MAG: hypothetical protein ACM3N0_10330 [Chloroflexota bacterium]